MAELVDAPDSKSGDGNIVWVRVPLSVPRQYNMTQNLAINNLHDILQSALNGSIVLTPNRRIAADLKLQLTNYLKNQTNTAYDTPQILPLDAWLVELWNNHYPFYLQNNMQLLSEKQELAIWEKIVEQDKTDWLFDKVSTAKMAKDTYDLIVKWDILEDGLANTYDEESRLYLKWHNKFNQYLKKQTAATNAALAKHIQTALEQNIIQISNAVIFAFFDEFIPSVDKLRQTLSAQTVVEIFENQQSQGACFVHAAKDTTNELIDMVCWAKKQYLSGKKRIACVVSDLQAKRSELLPIIDEYLNHQGKEIFYDISAGTSLFNYKIVKSAINIFQLQKINQLSIIQEILLCPYIKGYQEERAARNKIVEHLIQENVPDFSIQDILLMSRDQNSSYYSPILSEMLVKYLSNAHEGLDNQQPSEWLSYLLQILEIFQWPGSFTINSEEYQAYNKFEKILSSIISLDHVYTTTSLNKILSVIKYHTVNTDFQIESPKTSIQFLGVLEASGRMFDSVWIANITDSSWPQAPNPNPFIPRSIQSKYNLPHSTAERELVFCKKLTSRFSKSANEIVFSYGKLQEDRIQYPSPLVQQFPTYEKNYKIISKYTIQNNSEKFVFFEDDFAPGLEKSYKTTGGSEILRQQAECPFKAFTSFRLNIKEYSQPNFGISYLQRGILLHACLENTYSMLQKQSNANSQVDDLIKDAVDLAIQSNLSAKFIKYYKNLLKIEKIRLNNLIKEWLEFENARDNFSVKHLEHKQKIILGDLAFNLRIDRIDKINGAFAIVDYKSSAATGIDWFSDRPDAPQLLMYLISSQLDIRSLVLAQVKRGNMLYRGITCSQDGFLGLDTYPEIQDKHAWDSQKVQWQNTLEQLVENFKDGHAYIQPKYTTTCDNCGFNQLCRVNDEAIYYHAR